jgi:hypothetical protein
MIDIWQIDKSAEGVVTKTKLFGVMVSPPLELRMVLMGSMFL